MGILASLFSKAAASPIDAIGKVVDNVFTSSDEKLSHSEILERIKQKPYLAQIEINKIEAGHRSLFVAGWRPFIGWTCGTGLAYNFIARDIITWLLAIHSPETIPPPNLSLDLLGSLTLSLLGLGALRTVEKLGGRTK